MQPQIDNWLQYPSDRVMSEIEILTRKLNYHRSILIQRTMEYHEALKRLKDEPNRIWVTGNGEMTIEAIALHRLPGLVEIVATVETIESMIRAAEVGNLSNFYTGDALHQIAITPTVEKAAEEPNGAINDAETNG